MQCIVINPSVCVSVCLSVCKRISGTTGPISTKFCVWIPCGHGSVLPQWCCATLCTSSFMDDVMLGRNGRDAKWWRLTRYVTAMNSVAILGRILAKRTVPYWSNPPFFSTCCASTVQGNDHLSFQYWSSAQLSSVQHDYFLTFWRSFLSARVPKCQNIKNGGLDQYGPEHFEV